MNESFCPQTAHNLEQRKIIAKQCSKGCKGGMHKSCGGVQRRKQVWKDGQGKIY